MDRNLHYHIRWSGKAELDWECFDTRFDAEASAKKLVQQRETFTIEEHDRSCPRCADAMKLKTEHGTSSGRLFY